MKSKRELAEDLLTAFGLRLLCGGGEGGKGHDIKIELDERLRRSLGPLGAREMGEG